jgi:hypothetical protein
VGDVGSEGLVGGIVVAVGGWSRIVGLYGLVVFADTRNCCLYYVRNKEKTVA